MIDDFFDALRLVTALPFLPKPKVRQTPSQPMFFFPLVGALIGLVALALYVLLYPLLNVRLANFVLLVVPILLTGARPLNSLAAILKGKDSRKDLVLAISIPLILIAKFELLQELPFKGLSFLLALTLARWAQVALSFYWSAAKTESGAGLAVSRTGVRELIGATAFLFVITLFSGWTGFFAFVALLVLLAMLGLWFHDKSGPARTEFLGAISEISELFVFLMITVLSRG